MKAFKNRVRIGNGQETECYGMDTENQEGDEKCKPLYREARDLFIVKGKEPRARRSWTCR
jgi:hypothetical protein